MGKGGGCKPSKEKVPVFDQDPPLPKRPSSVPAYQVQLQPQIINTAIPIQNSNGQTPEKLKIFIIFYSMYGHVEFLARRIKKGVDSVDGVEGVMYRVAETLPVEILEQMDATPVGTEFPVISVDELVNADGFLFGFPTRFGSMAAQMKAFFDSTVELWMEQKLAGLPAGFFVSTGTQGGGQETAGWTAVTQLVHHGMLYVPIGYTFGDEMCGMESIRAGSPFGAGVYAGDGSRHPNETEMALAEHQGKHMATIVKKFSKHLLHN